MLNLLTSSDIQEAMKHGIEKALLDGKTPNSFRVWQDCPYPFATFMGIPVWQIPGIEYGEIELGMDEDVNDDYEISAPARH